MKKTDVVQLDPINSITTDIKGVMSLLGVGRDKAREIGIESGAFIKLGKRSLYKVDVLKEYMNNL